MDDPAAEIAALRRELEELRASRARLATFVRATDTHRSATIAYLQTYGREDPDGEALEAMHEGHYAETTARANLTPGDLAMETKYG